MKTINYTGNSKLISRIVHLLNRKAPLPLDGDGDADWGTNGQVLTTDGNGNTSWTTPQGGGGDVTDVEVNGTSVVNAQGVAEVSVPTKTSDLNNDSGFIDGTDLSTALSDYTPTANLATVATSGDYDDLLNKPTIPTAASDITYDNTQSGLSATRVQGAIDEVSAKALYKYPRIKNLGTFTSTAQLETFLSNFGVATGNFDGDIQVGDYATIAGYKCYVAGFDTEYDKGDISLETHHVTFIANFGDSKMNETDTTAGGYEGATTMQNFLSGKETELEAICSSHLLTRRCITSTHVGSNGKSDVWDWNSHKLTLLTEQQLYGSIQWGNVYDTGEGYEKLPIFNYITPTRIFGQNYLWLRGVASATAFCYLDFDGRPNGYRASVNRKTVALFCLG